MAALRRAVAFKRFRAADVRSILAAGTGTPQPARPAMRWCWICHRADPLLEATRSRPPVTGAAHDHHNRYSTGCPRRSGPAADLEAGLRRLKLAAVRRTAPEVLQVAKTQRWTPEEVLRTLIEAEIAAGMPPTKPTG